MSPLADFRLPRRKNPDAEKRDLSVQIDSAAASLPICFKNTLRQPCYPCATSGAADGGASQRWGSPSYSSGLLRCSYKRRRSPTRGNTTRSTS